MDDILFGYTLCICNETSNSSFVVEENNNSETNPFEGIEERKEVPNMEKLSNSKSLLNVLNKEKLKLPKTVKSLALPIGTDILDFIKKSTPIDISFQEDPASLSIISSSKFDSPTSASNPYDMSGYLYDITNHIYDMKNRRLLSSRSQYPPPQLSSGLFPSMPSTVAFGEDMRLPDPRSILEQGISLFPSLQPRKDPSRHLKPIMESINPLNLILTGVHQGLALNDLDPKQTRQSMDEVMLVIREYNISKIEYLEAKDSYTQIRDIMNAYRRLESSNVNKNRLKSMLLLKIDSTLLLLESAKAHELFADQMFAEMNKDNYFNTHLPLLKSALLIVQKGVLSMHNIINEEFRPNLLDMQNELQKPNK